jgi:hypothetical protein
MLETFGSNCIQESQPIFPPLKSGSFFLASPGGQVNPVVDRQDRAVTEPEA